MAAARILRLKVEPEIRKMVGGDSVVATFHPFILQSNTLGECPGRAGANAVTSD
jgi:hypothetical protein